MIDKTLSLGGNTRCDNTTPIMADDNAMLTAVQFLEFDDGQVDSRKHVI